MLNVDGIEESKIIEEIENISSGNFSYSQRKVFNSICTTPHPLAEKIYRQYIELNHGDLRIFPGIKEFERKTIAMMGQMLGNRNCKGTMLSGGTEANILALYVAREKFRQSNPGKHAEILAFESRHFSIEKACKLLNLKLTLLPLNEHQSADTKSLKKQITENTAAIIATAGTSEMGSVDNIPEIAKIACENNIFLHVDAASGGFLIPFARKLGYRLPELSLQTKGINTMAVDPHKYGMAPIPSGGLLFNNNDDYNQLCFSSFFVNTVQHKSILGTRPGASVLATYAAMRNIGYNGYLKLTQKYFDLRNYFQKLLEEHQLKFTYKPDLNIVTLSHQNVDGFVAEMESKGWILSRSKNYNCLRLVLVNHHTKESINELFQLYLKSIKLNDTH